ncbi:AraC family transcriptional regulator [Nocardia sp. NPDC050697]|uniref:AraC family transcriptional regulator n=1 Tax=Nocardia sp. NPDC050697 TaxID=3155158 RepID=UPI0033C60A45
MDILSDAVAGLTTAPALSVLTRARAPWGLRFGGRQGFGLHVVVAGECLLLPSGGDPRTLRAGDVLLMPSGVPHILADARDTEPRDLVVDGRIGSITIGGAGAPAVVVSGAYRLEQVSRHPLLAELPAVVHLSGRSHHDRLHAAVDLLGAEIQTRAPGAEAIVSALVDALLIYVLRSWYEGKPTGWAVAIGDEAIGQSLHRMHSQPGEAWTVDRLAGELGLARATFTRRFTRLVGEPPLTYLTRWRMITAARLLRRGRAPLATIARQVGYTSEFAFAKAFKRQYGLAPGAYRRANRDRSTDADAHHSSPPELA